MSRQIENFRLMVTAQKKRFMATAIARFAIVLLIVTTASIVAYFQIEGVQQYLAALLSFDAAVLTLAAVKLNNQRKDALQYNSLDSKDMSQLFDADHPLAVEAIRKTQEQGFYTYADLDNGLKGFEKIAAAIEYAETGVNRKFKATPPKAFQASRKPSVASKATVVTCAVMTLTLIQLGVATGFVPTIHELFFGQVIPAFSLHMSLKEITYNILIPKGVTVLVLQAMKILVKNI